jgi:hypothetical protein
LKIRNGDDSGGAQEFQKSPIFRQHILPH